MGGVASANAIAAVNRDGAARRLACIVPSDGQLSAPCRDEVASLAEGGKARALSSSALLRELTLSRALPIPRQAPCPTSWYACACMRGSLGWGCAQDAECQLCDAHLGGSSGKRQQERGEHDRGTDRPKLQNSERS